MTRTAERRCLQGPMHGWPVPNVFVPGSMVWIDTDGRCHLFPAPGRALYRVDGDELRFAGHGARCCGSCGVTIDPDPETGLEVWPCQLCGHG